MIKIERILVPTDFSKASVPAIGYAFSLAQDHGAEVIVFHSIPMDVVNEKALGGYFPKEAFMITGTWITRINQLSVDALVRERVGTINNFLHKWVDPGLLKTVKVTPLVRLGEVVEEIVATANRTFSTRIENCNILGLNDENGVSKQGERVSKWL